MVQKSLSTTFNVIGPFQDSKYYPSYMAIPKPGQWIYVQSDNYSVPLTLVKITSVKISEITEGLIKVTLEFNRISPKEDILLAKLLKQQAELIDDEEQAVEPQDFEETITKTEELSIVVLTNTPSLSGVNSSDAEYSGVA